MERMTHADEIFMADVLLLVVRVGFALLKSQYPDMTKNLSCPDCKISASKCLGRCAKSYYAQILDVDPSRIFSVSSMPCVAKKHECAIPGMDDAGAARM